MNHMNHNTNHKSHESKSGFRSPTRWVSAPVEAPPRRASQQRPEDCGPIAPWSWRNAQQVKSAKSVKSEWCVDDVWMMCDVRWILILWISLEINSHPTVPCHNLTLKSTRPPWWVGLPVGCSTPEFHELSLAYKRSLRCIRVQTRLLTLKHRVRLFKPIIFSLKMESLSVTEIPL